jgi:hypothetical protein
MKETGFSLQPFLHDKETDMFRINGSLSRDRDSMALRYELSGPLKGMSIPPLSEQPCRKDMLWEDTCFELFLGTKYSEAYWEFNLSPSGDWNVYGFNGYREGMQPEEAFNHLPFIVHITRDILCLEISFDAKEIIGEARPLVIGISAVLMSLTGKTSYWAISHNGPRPDFHRRDNFTIELNL